MKKATINPLKKGRPGNSIPEPSATISVKIQPRASRNEIALAEDGGIRIKLTAPPVDGAANEALIKLLAGRLSLAKSSIVILSGETGRNKILKISGLTNREVESLLKTAKQ